MAAILSDDVLWALGMIQVILAVIVPFLIYYANLRLLGGRIQFRVLSFLCVGVTGLLMTIYTINNLIPLHELTLEGQGIVEDTDSYVLGAMIGGIQLGMIGTVPTAIVAPICEAAHTAAGNRGSRRAKRPNPGRVKGP